MGLYISKLDASKTHPTKDRAAPLSRERLAFKYLYNIGDKYIQDRQAWQLAESNF